MPEEPSQFSDPIPASGASHARHEANDMSLYYPVDPMQLPPELEGVDWPPGT